jgi:hypothetical protein
MPWEERARKLEGKKRRMVVHGRGLLTVEPHAASKRLKKLTSRRGRKSTKR